MVLHSVCFFKSAQNVACCCAVCKCRAMIGLQPVVSSRVVLKKHSARPERVVKLNYLVVIPCHSHLNARGTCAACLTCDECLQRYSE